jgi:hypothetical protein
VTQEELVQDWKQSVRYCLLELYAYRQAIEQIQQIYFEGQTVLFPDVTRDLAEIITQLETTVGNLNASFVETFQYYQPLGLKAIRDYATKEVNRVMAYIVDMAKDETLDCLGDREEGVKLVERYL